jgi:hypothetical protein
MKRIVCVLCILFVLCTPASAMPPRPVADFAEMVIVGAEIAPDGTWVVHANRFYDYYIMASGQFDRIDQHWEGEYSVRSLWLNYYEPRQATYRSGSTYIWDRQGWKGVKWFVPNRCTLTISMVSGENRVKSDVLHVLVLPAE